MYFEAKKVELIAGFCSSCRTILCVVGICCCCSGTIGRSLAQEVLVACYYMLLSLSSLDFGCLAVSMHDESDVF